MDKRVQSGSIKKECKVGGYDLEILRNLYDNQEGLRVNTLIKLISKIKQRNIYKHLHKLEKQGLIYTSYPIWKLTPSAIQTIQGETEIWAKLLNGNNLFELHDLSFVVNLIDKPDWWDKRNNKMIKLKEFQFKNISWGNNPYIQLINEYFIIQIFSDAMIIMNRKRYHGIDPYDVLIKGIEDFLNIFKLIEERFKFKFFKDGIPHVSIRSQNILRINDTLANICKKEGKSFLVCVNEKERVLVDYSEPFGLETVNKNYANSDMSSYQELVKDTITKKSFLPSEITQMMGQLIKNQIDQGSQIGEFAVALNRHIPAYEGMSKMVGELKEEIKRLNEVITKNGHNN